MYQDENGVFQHLGSAVRRGRHLRCKHCKQKGATIGCHNVNCNSVYHLHCCEEADLFMHPEIFMLMCNRHAPPKHKAMVSQAGHHISRDTQQR